MLRFCLLANIRILKSYFCVVQTRSSHNVFEFKLNIKRSFLYHMKKNSQKFYLNVVHVGMSSNEIGNDILLPQN